MHERPDARPVSTLVPSNNRGRSQTIRATDSATSKDERLIMNEAQALFKALTHGAVVALMLAFATRSWPEDGFRDVPTRAAQDARAMPAYHLDVGRFDGNLGRADVRVDDLAGVLFAQAEGVSGVAGEEPKSGDSGQANDHPEHAASLSEIGKKLANPVSDVWALFTEFDLSFSNGDVNRGDAKVGGRMLFQPVMPFPLYGKGKDEWKLITRPAIPVLFSEPVPKGLDEYNNLGGLGDIVLPMLLNPPAGSWILGLGPTWLFPSGTRDAFGKQQWGVGPAGVVGYATKEWIAFVFPQYVWGIGNAGRDKNTPDASYLNMIYTFFYNLPNAWQVGTNPTVSYDQAAPSGNKWNFPLGLTVSKTTKVGDVPVKFQLGLEYSVVSPDAFGQVAQIKLNIIPVIPSLVKEPIFGN
jgi:hypothetical protein